ncbi:hypothetical protein Ciccas_009385 [Cichlidogyrus casuarinus]|uniref:Uncharacterized protein n=1 Tax=Cichlidogyrus casuarinus TaxID=1844966 RepID=A0ABD2PX69_9PLAT
MGKPFYARCTLVFFTKIHLLKKENPTCFERISKLVTCNLSTRESSSVSLDFAQEAIHLLLKSNGVVRSTTREDHMEANTRFHMVQPLITSLLDIGRDNPIVTEEDETKQLLQHHSFGKSSVEKILQNSKKIENKLWTLNETNRFEAHTIILDLEWIVKKLTKKTLNKLFSDRLDIIFAKYQEIRLLKIPFFFKTTEALPHIVEFTDATPIEPGELKAVARSQHATDRLITYL